MEYTLKSDLQCNFNLVFTKECVEKAVDLVRRISTKRFGSQLVPTKHYFGKDINGLRRADPG